MAVLEIDSAPRCRVPGRFSRHVFWLLWVTIILIAAAFYYPKAADHRSAFVRWRPQVLKFWEGVNIYDKILLSQSPDPAHHARATDGATPGVGGDGLVRHQGGADDAVPGALPPDREAARSALSRPSSRARS